MANTLIIVEAVIIGAVLVNWPYIRKSCIWVFIEIKHPALMNNKALNIAWVDI